MPTTTSGTGHSTEGEVAELGSIVANELFNHEAEPPSESDRTVLIWQLLLILERC